jgi:hypothetical protein
VSERLTTSRQIDHKEAREIAQRLINSHFNQEPCARVGIPARVDYDDDLLMMAYIDQQERLKATHALEMAGLREVLRFYATEWQGNGEGNPEEPHLMRTWQEPTAELWADAGHKAKQALTATTPTADAVTRLVRLMGEVVEMLADSTSGYIPGTGSHERAEKARDDLVSEAREALSAPEIQGLLPKEMK